MSRLGQNRCGSRICFALCSFPAGRARRYEIYHFVAGAYCLPAGIPVSNTRRIEDMYTRSSGLVDVVRRDEESHIDCISHEILPNQHCTSFLVL